MMGHWVGNVTTRGAENIPEAGPLLVVSNHVGAYDILVVPAQINRPDLKIISSDIHYLKSLPHACEHLIFLTDDPHDRMTATRAGIRHLQGGSALLLFGTGRIDPDPAFSAEAEKHLEKWSPSIDLFLRMGSPGKSGFVHRQWVPDLALGGSSIDPSAPGGLGKTPHRRIRAGTPAIILPRHDLRIPIRQFCAAGHSRRVGGESPPEVDRTGQTPAGRPPDQAG
jgi:hypothetical protein